MSLPQNIILIGFMGSGKTSTGKEISQILNYHFWDMDQWIEENIGKKVPKIFEESGEEYFRSQEKKALDWLKSKDHYVVSTGGGVWMDEENRRMLLKMGWCIWLKVSPEVVFKRVGTHLKQRPLLAQSNDPLKTITNFCAERNPVYSQAHTSFDTNEKKPRDVAIDIVNALKRDNPFDLPQLQK